MPSERRSVAARSLAPGLLVEMGCRHCLAQDPLLFKISSFGDEDGNLASPRVGVWKARAPLSPFNAKKMEIRDEFRRRNGERDFHSQKVEFET